MPAIVEQEVDMKLTKLRSTAFTAALVAGVLTQGGTAEARRDGIHCVIDFNLGFVDHRTCYSQTNGRIDGIWYLWNW